jgi:hypothetical protein
MYWTLRNLKDSESSKYCSIVQYLAPLRYAQGGSRYAFSGSIQKRWHAVPRQASDELKLVALQPLYI